MELSEKLQELRKEKGLTQEELAEALFVSRTAISKWESGRGVPNIESLKAISKFFSVSIDELLSGEEILKIADEDNKQKEKHTRDLVFGLLDCSLIMFLFLPFFGQKGDEIIKEVSLLSLTGTPQYIKIPYLIIVFGIVLTGVLLLALQNYEAVFWLKHKHQISIVLPLCFILGFALLGLIQLIKRKSLFKVDSSILVLGAFYIVVMAAYLFFEFYVVNYRPVLINGFLEASYPSSTTLLVMCVMPTAVMQLNSRIRNTKMKRAFAFALIAFTAFMVIGRLISGVHWITDIIGGAILSAGLVMIYYSVTTLIARQER